jgi:hypothetical protein
MTRKRSSRTKKRYSRKSVISKKKYSRKSKSKSKSKKRYSRKKRGGNFDHSGWNNVFQQFITQKYNDPSEKDYKDPNEIQQLLNQIGGKKLKKKGKKYKKKKQKGGDLLNSLPSTATINAYENFFLAVRTLVLSGSISAGLWGTMGYAATTQAMTSLWGIFNTILTTIAPVATSFLGITAISIIILGQMFKFWKTIYDDRSDFNNQMLRNENLENAELKFKTLVFSLQCFEAIGNITMDNTKTIFSNIDHVGLINKFYFDAGFQENRVMALWYLKPDLFQKGTKFFDEYQGREEEFTQKTGITGGYQNNAIQSILVYYDGKKSVIKYKRKVDAAKKRSSLKKDSFKGQDRASMRRDAAKDKRAAARLNRSSSVPVATSNSPQGFSFGTAQPAAQPPSQDPMFIGQ